MSDTRFTPGPWDVVQHPTPSIKGIRGPSFDVRAVMWASDLDNSDYERRQADLSLMAAAPDGFDAAGAAYLAILQSPMNKWRAEVGMDGTLAMLRDFIAKATNREPQDVQAEYERRARDARGQS